MSETILFVDDEEHLRIAGEQTFQLAELDCQCLATAEEALAQLSVDFAGVIVTDIRMPGMDGVTLLQQVLEIDSEIPVILVTGHGDVELAVACMRDGAYDFLEKPCRPAQLVTSVQRALERRRLTLENRALREQVNSSNVIESRLTGRSARMVALRQSIKAVAAADVDTLITGDTGTGKEIAARAIHVASSRGQKPFVHVNCAALPADLMEIELFGSEAGAFPGSVRARVGRLEHARGGILCLDEVDTLSLPLQAKLLDVLHNRQITRLGSNDAIPLDIRVIAISKVNLETAVQEGFFRPDLLYRLNVVTINMPTIAERREDIPHLFSALVAQAANRYELAVPQVPASLQASLVSRDWSGNVREIRNEAERFVLGLAGADESEAESSQSLAAQMSAHEKALISSAIQSHGGRLKGTYESLKLSRKTLYDKMRKHGLTRDDFTPDE